jgi:hypothetical protein
MQSREDRELRFQHTSGCAHSSSKKRVHDLLELTNVGSLFQIYPTLNEAIASLPPEAT